MPKESLADERARLAMETKTLGENLKGIKPNKTAKSKGEKPMKKTKKMMGGRMAVSPGAMAPQSGPTAPLVPKRMPLPTDGPTAPSLGPLPTDGPTAPSLGPLPMKKGGVAKPRGYGLARGGKACKTY